MRACGATTIYRQNSAGERVRMPALQIVAAGCTCQDLRHHTNNGRVIEGDAALSSTVH